MSFALQASRDLLQTRARLYRLLEEPFRFPGEDQTRKFIDGSWQKELSACIAGLDIRLPEVDGLQLDLSAKQYEVEFIALYEVGMGGAPCPLHSGHYTRDRMKTMEEVLRFYRFFDYHPDRSADRFPDHINFELQFMAHMAALYEEEMLSDGDVESALLGQRDFVNRNLLSWLPDLSERIEQRSKIDFFKNVGRCVLQIVQIDSNMLEQLVHQLESVDEGELQK